MPLEGPSTASKAAVIALAIYVRFRVQTDEING